ncbi:MAG: AAA family ATPase [Gammaproteobacteria bacterium]
MKILAIRGANLASLEAFALEFEREPLVSAGLYAITGPTGAGKSTLLDALCLALFDKIPRLADSAGVAVGHPESERLKDDDVRNILRRGATCGFAEVDFIGCDRKRYRARWEARRARGKSAGKLQLQTLSLIDLASGAPLTRHKTEALQAIRERLGLDFDQFRRAVLLAQGDFAAFLKAKANDRSMLLERITGTEIYGVLSRKAHTRAVAERAELDALTARLTGVQPLSVEARVELEQRRDAARAARQRIEAEQRLAERDLGWHRTLLELRERQRQATDEHDLAEQYWREAEPRRSVLAAALRAQTLRGLRDHHQRAARAQTAAESLAAGAQADVQAARGSADERALTLAAADRRWQSAAATWNEAQPALYQARALDADLVEAAAAAAQLEPDLQRASQQAAAAEQALGALRAQRQRHEQQHDEAAAWLAAHSPWSALARQWERWDAELQRYRDADRACSESEARCVDLRARLSLAERDAAAAMAAVATAAQVLEEHQRRWAEAEEQVQIGDVTALARRRRVLEQRRVRLRRVLELGDEIFRQRGVEARYRDEQARCSVQFDAVGAEAASVAAQLDQQRKAVHQARHEWLLAQAAANADVRMMRAQLRHGDACPVCGATEHPWTGDYAPPAAVEMQRIKLAECERGEEDLAARQARLAQERLVLRERLAALSERRQELAAILRSLDEQWRLEVAEPGDAGGVDAGRLAEAEVQHALVLRGLLGLAASEMQAQRAQASARTARAALDQARAQHERAQAALQTHREALQALRFEEQNAAQAYNRVLTERATVLATLAEPLAAVADGAAALGDDASAFHMRCRDVCTEWGRQRQRLEAAANGLRELDAQLAAAVLVVQHAGEQQHAFEVRRDQQLRAWEALRQARAACCGGQPVAAFEQELRRAEQIARQQQTEAQRALDEAQRMLALAQAAEAQHRAQLESARSQVAQLERELARALTQQGLTAAELEQLLAYDSVWLEDEQQALADGKTHLDEARVRLDERRARLAEHTGRDQPARGAGEAEADLARLEMELAAAQQTWVASEGELAQDEQKRGQLGELLADSERQSRRHALWQSLDDLIGSHDGAKFRTFAQSLTFESLIAYANRHLGELSQRYRLARVPGTDLELQVLDREMGDEVRSAHSLSGGETFLVSLALALALASLSASRAPVESLFIDEGFGTLDGTTLDVALACLDVLQAQGCQVGVISHVPAMLERVGVQVRVEPRGGGRSAVRIVGV